MPSETDSILAGLDRIAEFRRKELARLAGSDEPFRLACVAMMDELYDSLQSSVCHMDHVVNGHGERMETHEFIDWASKRLLETFAKTVGFEYEIPIVRQKKESVGGNL